MRTSPQQFEMLITYMEQHGDLSKPSTNARGRIGTIQHWENLTSLLNSDGSGDTKTMEKWKKVWSDYKNNTKKKAARIHRAATGTGGGQALYSRLTDLEQRVLNLIGVQVATGLAVEEAGLPPVEDNLFETQEANEPSETNPENQEDPESWNQPGPSILPHVGPPLPTNSPQIHFVDSDIVEGTEEINMSPVPHAATPPPEQQPDRVGQTPTRRPTRRGTPPRFARRSPRRPRATRISQNEVAAQHFLASDTEWREFRMRQHRETMDMRRDENAVRQMEVQAQREFQTRALDILDKLVTKFCSDRS